MSNPVCPRCTGLIPNSQQPGLYSGAVSRADDETEICSACGDDEALREHMAGVMILPDHWPVIDPHEYANILKAQVS